jgi:DNA-binding transcriptional LysR family regulator
MGLVRAGLGVTFISPSEARTLPAEIVFRPLLGPAPESRLVMGWKAQEPLPAPLAAFVMTAEARSRSS